MVFVLTSLMFADRHLRWAGGASLSFSILFAVKQAEGDCRRKAIHLGASFAHRVDRDIRRFLWDMAEGGRPAASMNRPETIEETGYEGDSQAIGGAARVEVPRLPKHAVQRGCIQGNLLNRFKT